MTTSASEFDEAQAYLTRMRDDEEFALSQLITIKTKTGKPQPFKLWPSQRKFLKHKARINDVIKIRQQGFSVLSIARRMAMARLALFFPEMRNRQATIFCKDDEDAPIMFNHVKFMDAHLPPAFQGEKEHDAAKVIHYSDTGWVIRIMTAGKSEAAAISKGRSSTDPYPHITECGYIKNLATLYAGVLNSMPPDYSEMVMESTSSGPRGFFSQHFLGTVQNGKEIDDNVWAWDDRRSFFFSFLEHPEYIKDVPDRFDCIDAEEERLMKLGAPPERIMWRRSKLADMGKMTGSISPELQFKRDYPATLSDAFEEAGGAFFNAKTMVMVRDWAKRQFPEPIDIGLNLVEGDNPQACLPTHTNRITVWRPPAKGWRNRYVTFWDCAQGRPDGDYDVGMVLDLVTWEVCAMARGRWGAEIATALAIKMARYYGTALLAWDATGIGAEWRPLLLNSGYPNIWARYKIDKQSLDPYSFGMIWTGGTKSEACSTLRNMIENRNLHIPDGEFYEEEPYFSYQDKEDLNPEAATGFHDDVIMCAAGLVYVGLRAGAPTKETGASPFTDQRRVDLKKMIAKANQGKDYATKLAGEL